jgi:hypothetical protein
VNSLTRGRCLGLAFGSMNMLIGAVLRAAALTTGLSVFLATLEGAESGRSLATATWLLLVVVTASLGAFSVATGVTSEARRGGGLPGAVDDLVSFVGWGFETRSVSLSLDAAALLTAPLDWDFFKALGMFDGFGLDVTTVAAVSRK